MAFGGLRRRADALAVEAARLARERNAHARQSVALAQKALASPTALVLCFAAGVVVGTPGRRPRARRVQDPAGEAGPESRIGRWLAGPVGAVALRAAAAYLAAARPTARPGEPPPAAG